MNVNQKLNELGIIPEKGQRFLWSDNNAEALAAACEPDGKDILEIGPGLGIVTQHLVNKADKVTAVEKNSKLANYLNNEIDDDDLTVVNEDFRKFSVPEETESIVGNIPFSLTKEILEKVIETEKLAALLIQKDVAEKVTAEPGSKKYTFYSLKIQIRSLPVKLRTIDSRYFEPEPEVDGAILKLYPRKTPLTDRPGKIIEILKPLFNNSNKKVRNSFVDSRHLYGISKEEAKDCRSELKYSDKRVNKLTVKESVELGEELCKILDK